MTQPAIPLYLRWNGDAAAPDVMLAGSGGALAALGRRLLRIDATIGLPAQASSSPSACAHALARLCLEPNEDASGPLRITLAADALVKAGSAAALRGLGQSLVDVFDDGAPAGRHIRMDAASGLVHPTSCDLVMAVAS